MKKILLHTFLLFTVSSYVAVKAQDPHFSQYFNTPLYVNPANAGNGIEYMRATLIYRNQWASVASPFVTEGLMVDKKVNKIGFGFLVVKNSAGKSSLKQLNLAGTLSYNQPIGDNNQVTGALQVGMLHKSFDPSDMTFDNQYSEDLGFDPAASTGEVFTNTSITRPDVGAGIMWQRGFTKPKIKFKPFVGLAISHLNKPSETFIVDDNKLPVKSTINFGAGIMLKKNIELKPSVVYMIQDHAHEFSYGVVSSFVLENNNRFQAGLYNRSNDAVIAYLGYQVNQLFIGTSYDINVSGLKEVSHGNGGFEITLSYIPKNKKRQKPEEHKNIVKKQTPAKMKKSARVDVKPFEQTVGIPEKLEARTVKLPERKNEAKQTMAQVKTEVAMVVPKTVAPEQNEVIIQASRENVSAVSAKEALAVKNKNINTPAKLKQPADRSVLVAKVKPVIEKEEITALPVAQNKTTIIPETKAPEVVPTEKTITIAAPVLKKEPVTEVKATVPAPVVAVRAIAENKIKDTDSDGITDDKDECPYIKGSIKTNGCPDSDGDGIVDMKDHCPMEPGSVSANGCPQRKVAFDKSMLIKNFNNIEFETGKAVVKTTDVYDIIEYAIDFMYEYPNSKILLSGHTDTEGNDLFNMQLSQERTDVVKKYLVKQGVDESRIQTVDYGESMPLMDNNSEYGKARNRRVEINILNASAVN